MSAAPSIQIILSLDPIPVPLLNSFVINYRKTNLKTSLSGIRKQSDVPSVSFYVYAYCTIQEIFGQYYGLPATNKDGTKITKLANV